MKIAVDFDGTCVLHEYPGIGEDVPWAVETLKWLAENGWQIILYTMRSGRLLLDAVCWFEARGIPLYGINTNPDQKAWTVSPKCYANFYVDDAAIGCPLVTGMSERPYVDWKQVRRMVVSRTLG